MPVIGITSCRKLEDYRQSVLHVGGEVRILEPSADVEAALAGIDGLLLTGGNDVAPTRYGEAPHSTFVEAEPGRDEFELKLVAGARARNLPIFAICRGVQLLNVACGGTLVQDIPSQVAGALPHSLTVPPHESYSLAHEVWLDKGTLLSNLMGERLSDNDACDVNSRHHQAVKPAAAEPVALPKPLAERLGVIETRKLLRALDEPATIGCFVASFDEQVNVVRHEAVRND